METVLGAAFGSQVNVLKGEGDSLTEAAAGILAEVDISVILWNNLISCNYYYLKSLHYSPWFFPKNGQKMTPNFYYIF